MRLYGKERAALRASRLIRSGPLKVGAPFNPYRIFQGSFAPYWLLEHRGISAGAKLCYVRLLGFAGKDARCYPSLETLGASLGVSDRQARDYVKELQREGLIAIEQRGLRKTNVYLFVWTKELDRLMNSVPDASADPDEAAGGETPPASPPDRNDGSTQDRNSPSTPGRNNCSVLDRKPPAAPIGINSSRINSPESSSSSSATDLSMKGMTQDESMNGESAIGLEPPNQLAETIHRWATQRGLQRLRADRRMGYPDAEHVRQWSRIFQQRDIAEVENIFAVLDAAVHAATRSGEWRNWAFLTLQVQLAAERLPTVSPALAAAATPAWDLPDEDPSCDWALAKQKIRRHIGEVPFVNWFERTRQVERRKRQITIAVSDETSGFFLEAEYGNLTRAVLAEFGIDEIELAVTTRDSNVLEPEPRAARNACAWEPRAAQAGTNPNSNKHSICSWRKLKAT
jgi:helix-turn-helix protein